MQTTTRNPLPASPAQPFWAETTVALRLDDGSYLLDDGRLALQASSCLLVPGPGDRVLVAACRQGENFILHLLVRPRSGEACLSVPGASQLTLRQSRISLVAGSELTLQSLRDVEITAATGVLRLSARDLFTTVAGSLVQNVRHFVGKAEQYLLDVRQVLRLHGRQASITAEHDVKIDADRISMG